MTHQAVSAAPLSPLTIEKSFAEYEQEVKRLSTIAWHIAYTALWNTLDFSAKEKQQALSFITKFILEADNQKKGYSDFVQRVILARQYINTHGTIYIPIPSQWLNAENKKGFAGTAPWLESLKATRTSLPQYKIAIKAFAEAIVETVESGAAKDFHYWRSYFINQNAQGLLNLFLSTIANCQNSIPKTVNMASYINNKSSK